MARRKNKIKNEKKKGYTKAERKAGRKYSIEMAKEMLGLR